MYKKNRTSLTVKAKVLIWNISFEKLFRNEIWNFLHALNVEVAVRQMRRVSIRIVIRVVSSKGGATFRL